MKRIHELKGGVRIAVRLQPRSAKNQVVGWQNEALKIKVTAPPVDGEANKALIHYLSQSLGDSKSSCKIIAGETSRNKIIEIQGISKQEFMERLKI